MDIPLNEIKTEEIPKKENIESEEINVKIIKQDKSKQKNYENINSPQLIQQILKLSTQSIQNDYYHQNKVIKSLYSFNDSILPIIDTDFNDNNNTTYNPRIQFLSQKNKLSCMNFGQINKNNNYLLNKIEQYNDLKQKISDYKLKNNPENNEKENNDNDDEKDLNIKLFLVNHPLINLFKDEIDLIEIKKEIEKEYQKKMKDNSDYKPNPLLNPHLINIQEPVEPLNEDEIFEESENSNEEGSLEESSGSHENSYLEIQPNEPIQHNEPIEPIQPNEPIEPIEPDEPIPLFQHLQQIQDVPNIPEYLPFEPIEHINLGQNENNNNEVHNNLNIINIEPINEQDNQLQINPPQNIIAHPMVQIIPPLPNIVNPPIPQPQINIQSELNNNELMDIEEMENNQEINNNNENEENQNNDKNNNENEEKKENNE